MTQVNETISVYKRHSEFFNNNAWKMDKICLYDCDERKRERVYKALKDRNLRASFNLFFVLKMHGDKIIVPKKRIL